MNEINKIFKALSLLERCGIHIREVYCDKEFIDKARDEKSKFTWVDKKEFSKKYIKKEGKDFEGIMFGITIRKSDLICS